MIIIRDNNVLQSDGLISFSFAGEIIVKAEEEFCKFGPHHMQCSEDECSKFCEAKYDQNAPSHCMNPISCCCEEKQSIGELNGTEKCIGAYYMGNCNAVDCRELCRGFYGKPCFAYFCSLDCKEPNLTALPHKRKQQLWPLDSQHHGELWPLDKEHG
ncbi:hypothetical protein ACOSQ4_022229 [Xanthoceras sorbifolium]